MIEVKPVIFLKFNMGVNIMNDDLMEDDDIAKQIFRDIQELDKRMISGSSVRSSIINKLTGVVDIMEIDPNQGKASDIEAKMSIINTLLKTVNDEESQRIQAIRVKQGIKKDKDTEDALSSIGDIVTGYLKNINPHANIVPVEAASSEHQDKIIEEHLKDKDFEILDGELEMSTPIEKDA